MSLDLDAYFRRIGYDGPAEPSLEAFRAVHRLHPIAIPFENLDSRFGVVPSLDLAAIQAKLVGGRRGGYCFEHNTLFAAVLRAMGFAVQTLIARVRWRLPEEAPATPRSHMLLRVEADGESWIGDVGFGGLVLTGPLRLEFDTRQETPHEPFRLVQREGEIEQQAWLGDRWAPTYRFDLTPAQPVDYELGNWFVATSPQSHFTQALMVARATSAGRLTLGDGDLTRRGAGGRVERTAIADGAALARLLRNEFGIEPPPGANLDLVVPAIPA